MLSHLLLIAVGAFAGGIARVALSETLLPFSLPYLPLGTVSVNLLGCFFMGLFAFAKKDQKGSSVPLLRCEKTQKLLLTGFLGAFTTFSAFGLELSEAWLQNQPFIIIFDVFEEVILGIGCIFAGGLLRHKLWP